MDKNNKRRAPRHLVYSLTFLYLVFILMSSFFQTSSKQSNTKTECETNETNDSDVVLIKNSKISVIKKSTKHISINFDLINKNVQLNNIIDFPVFKLIYDLNQDIYDLLDFKIIDSNTAVLFALYKNLLKDLGGRQRYMYAKITKKNQGDKVFFETVPIYVDKDNLPFPVPDKAYQSCFINTTIFHIISPSYVKYTQNVIFDEPEFTSTIITRVIASFIKKIYLRTKEFIEKM
jgi:hypothetical protein